MTPQPPSEVEAQLPVRRSLVRVFVWSVLAAGGGAILYAAFGILTGLEASLVGIPVGLAVGQAVYYASQKRGGRWFQVLALVLAYLAFDLSYAPGIAGIAFKDGITVLTFGFFVFLTLVSPVIDSHNGYLGQFMVFAGMYLAWTLTRRR